MKIFFITKKLLGAMLMPLQFSLALIVVGVVLLWIDRRRRLAKYLVTAGTVLLLIFSNRFVGYHLVHDLEARYPPFRLAGAGADPGSGVQALLRAAQADGGGSALGQRPVSVLGPNPTIVVLSGGASDDPGLPVADRLYPDSALRVVEAVEIYEKLATPMTSAAESNGASDQPKPTVTTAPRMVMSGGPTLNAAAEAVPMRKLAELLGVPSSVIVLETHSNDTASEAKDILPYVGQKPFILVTSAFHMPRAMGLFRHLGMQPIPAPANYVARWNTQPFVMNVPPDAAALVQSEVAGHELLGMIWEHLRGQL
ncbi:MAG TPA: ElyC/SanA/YdcF family protein [Terriglobia bacterium]|nr:ElyC/SanA/YdcF family protein [Terriglobia bacterium]